jgi:hypothetical protein
MRQIGNAAPRVLVEGIEGLVAAFQLVGHRRQAGVVGRVKSDHLGVAWPA